MMETMEAPAPRKRKAGRAYIGPKAQTHIAPHIHIWACSTAKERGITPSDVWRELLEEAYERHNSGDK